MGKLKAIDTALIDAGVQQPCQLYWLPDGSMITLVNIVDADGRLIESVLSLVTGHGVHVLEAIPYEHS